MRLAEAALSMTTQNIKHDSKGQCQANFRHFVDSRKEAESCGASGSQDLGPMVQMMSASFS